MSHKSTKAPPSLATIRETLRAQMPTLQQRYGVRHLGIFGSHARGKADARSDWTCWWNLIPHPPCYASSNWRTIFPTY